MVPMQEAEERGDAADLGDYLHVLRERYWVVVVSLLVVAALVVAATLG